MKQLRFHALALSVLALSSAPLRGGDIEYLALGDSVAFGYDPLVTVPIEANYTGYPEIVARNARPFRRVSSLACPGETSGSFLSATAPDNNCRAFKGAFGLHTNYLGTQGDYAIQLLTGEREIKLVTISIGGNDLILLQNACQNRPACILQGLPATLAAYAQNLTRILTRIRHEARYRGRVVLLTYYSPDYRDPLQTGGIGALNVAAAQVAAQFGVRIAEGFGAFALASAPYGGDTCAAGLLIRFTPALCDVHPSPKGRDLLADTVLKHLPGR